MLERIGLSESDRLVMRNHVLPPANKMINGKA